MSRRERSSDTSSARTILDILGCLATAVVTPSSNCRWIWASFNDGCRSSYDDRYSGLGSKPFGSIISIVSKLNRRITRPEDELSLQINQNDHFLVLVFTCFHESFKLSIDRWYDLGAWLSYIFELCFWNQKHQQYDWADFPYSGAEFYI